MTAGAGTDEGADDGTARRRRWVRRLQRYLLNPPSYAMARVGLRPGLVILETTGRVSGRRRRTVVGLHREGDVGWIVAEHGRHAGYVRNLAVQPTVRVCWRSRWRDASASVVESDDPIARLESFRRPSHAAIVRRLGTDLLTVRVDFAV